MTVEVEVEGLIRIAFFYLLLLSSFSFFFTVSDLLTPYFVINDLIDFDCGRERERE